MQKMKSEMKGVIMTMWKTGMKFKYTDGRQNGRTIYSKLRFTSINTDNKNRLQKHTIKSEN